MITSSTYRTWLPLALFVASLFGVAVLLTLQLIDTPPATPPNLTAPAILATFGALMLALAAIARGHNRR